MSHRLIVEHIDPARLVPGGIDTCIHDIVKYAVDARICIVGITSDHSVTLGRWTSVEFAGRSVPFLPVCRLDRSSLSFVSRYLPHSLLFNLGVLRYRGKIPRELVQVHRIETGFVLGCILRRRMIQFVHNDSEGLTGRNSDSVWRKARALYRSLERSVLQRAEGVVLFNATDASRMRRLREDLVVAETWFDPEVFRLRQDNRAEEPETLKILLVGRLEAQKDPLLAVEVFEHVRRRIPQAELQIVGDGSLGGSVRALAEARGVIDGIRFIGSVSRIEVARLMATSSVLLMTSHYEGSPRVLAEAGGSGLPVVATPGADPDLALVRGENGIRVDGRDPEKLAQAVIEAARYGPAGCRAPVEHRSAPRAIKALMAVGVRPARLK